MSFQRTYSEFEERDLVTAVQQGDSFAFRAIYENHRDRVYNLINVGLSASAADNCPGVVVSVAVFGDEDDETPTGDGTFSPDAKNIAVGTLRLRS